MGCFKLFQVEIKERSRRGERELLKILERLLSADYVQVQINFQRTIFNLTISRHTRIDRRIRLESVREDDSRSNENHYHGHRQLHHTVKEPAIQKGARKIVGSEVREDQSKAHRSTNVVRFSVRFRERGRAKRRARPLVQVLVQKLAHSRVQPNVLERERGL